MNYKDTENKVHWLDADQDESVLPDGCIQITEEQAYSLLNPTPTAEQMKAQIKLQIDGIEAAQFMKRGEREGWLSLIVSMAQGQGITEAALYADNPFYRRLKDTDTAVAALRAQL